MNFTLSEKEINRFDPRKIIHFYLTRRGLAQFAISTHESRFQRQFTIFISLLFRVIRITLSLHDVLHRIEFANFVDDAEKKFVLRRVEIISRNRFERASGLWFIFEDCSSYGLQMQLGSTHGTMKRILTTQVIDSVASADVRQESISQSLSFGGAFHQTSDIDDIQESRNLAVNENATLFISL